VRGKRELWRWGRALGVILFAGVVAVAAARRADKQGPGTDFHVFWRAGYEFAHGLPLYRPPPGTRELKYPPFAAQVFQPLGILPLRTAAWLFYVASVGLIFLAIWLCRDILRGLEPARRPGPLPLMLATLCSAGFMVDNLVHVQMNLVTFVLCLLGIRAFVARREVAGAGWLVAATAIKLVPAFFLPWVVIRGSKRSVLAVLAFAILCLILPVVQRGPTQGWTDLTEYYSTFLQQYTAGAVVTNYRNQNLAALVYRAVVPAAAEDLPGYDYAYLPSLAPAAPLLYRGLALLVLAGFLANLIRLRAVRRKVGGLEISSVFLTAHLLSGITFKAHLVTLLFVFYTFFVLDPKRVGAAARWAMGLAWAGIVIIGLGRDMIGSRIHHYLAGYSAFVWVMLLLFGLSVTWSGKLGSEQLGVRGEK